MANTSTKAQHSYGNSRSGGATNPLAGISISPQLANTLRKFMEVLGLTLGPALVAFNVFNFHLSKLGFFYKDPARFGISVGVLLIAISIISRRSRP